ncbi:MAG: hypothetical protein JRI57_00680 [Deltaproteobacteria bacterium]|nr:hypothetical protein [Deltaproteobacteria bacterium]MBW1952846.1 hypothetical protein [Deltaproteobacteria bacterium]MBW1985844.1 hypothetical protein [Deltaproteobacteria bacterium]MBW2133605.1 hypothetical protein [Deltaproteobacteria bacterium]
MSRIIKLLLALMVMVGCLAYGPRIQNCLAGPPAHPQKGPQWHPVKGVHGVEYASDSADLPGDLFRYGKKYYYYHQGNWYHGETYRGPWKRVQRIPPIFREIGPEYYKTPPGWSKGKKTGWGGAPMPPGQMKKQRVTPWPWRIDKKHK